ncbi:hypothetical protein K438DRAFT_1974856 [Mycena galopus ATCC 62051]|nr:hypothetical protein K438DRAFT_1974856 [Mycena galopus ATCC 62051]
MAAHVPSNSSSKSDNRLKPPQPDADPSDKKDKTSFKDRLTEMTTAYTNFGSEFDGNNSDEIASSTTSVAAAIDVSEMKDKMKTLSESSKLLMKALDEVQKLHPFVGVVVLAFKAVISLGLKRKNNNATVLALQVKMQEMMCDFVQLRIIKPDHKLYNGTTVKEILSDLCQSIAEDIEKCGNLCDKYSKTSFLGQLLKSPVYNERFSEFMVTFETRKSDLDHKMLLLTTIRVYSADEGISAIQEKVKSTEEHIKTMMALLERLQSPLQQKLWTAIKLRGSPKECLADEKFIEDLILMSEGLAPTSTPKSDNMPKAPFASMTPADILRSNFTTNLGLSPHNTPPLRPQHYTPNAAPRPFSPANSSDSYAHRFGSLKPRSSSFDQSRPVSRQDSLGSLGLVGFPSHGIVRTASKISNPAKPFTETPYASRGASFAQSDDSGPPTARQQTFSSATPSLAAVATALRKEMSEDVDIGLQKNIQTFTRKLHAQQELLAALENTIVQQSNQEMKELWAEMGWKLSVPDREFVLNLHDYYLAKYSEPIDIQYFNAAMPEGTTIEELRGALKKALSSAKARTEDKWALNLLTFQNLPKVLEAFDGDGSGFVSVWEVNQLTSACPNGWTLLQWLAYWILGSHWTVWIYRSKICEILQKMHRFAEGIKSEKSSRPKFKGKSILSANRFFVDEYLDGIHDFDKILASLRPPDEVLDPHLADQFSTYADAEEKRLEHILRTLNYEIDGVDTVFLIIGRHQIERNLFPVLYLLLKRHLQILYQARDVVFDRSELASCVNSVNYILDSVHLRVNNLLTSYAQQRSPNPEAQLSEFAFGMYCRLCFGPDLLHADILALLELSEAEIDRQHPNENPETEMKSILKYRAPYETYPDIPNRTDDSIQLSSQSSVCGPWTGHFKFHQTDKVAPYGMIQFSLTPDSEHIEYTSG